MSRLVTENQELRQEIESLQMKLAALDPLWQNRKDVEVEVQDFIFLQSISMVKIISIEFYFFEVNG